MNCSKVFKVGIVWLVRMVSVKVDLGKRDFIWMVPLFVVLIGVGLVVAYGSGNPVIHGHDAGEIESAVGEGGGFGTWEARDFDTTYKAATDGFIVGWMGGNTYPYTDVFVDGNQLDVEGEVSSVRRARFANWNGYSHPNSKVPFGIMVPVPKDEYWKVSVENKYATPSVQSGTLFFLPTGA